MHSVFYPHFSHSSRFDWLICLIDWSNGQENLKSQPIFEFLLVSDFLIGECTATTGKEEDYSPHT